MPYKDKKKQAEYSRKWTKANRVKHRQYQKNRHAVIHKWYKEFKKSLECIRCGFSDYRALQFHHRNPEEKTANVSEMVRTSCCASVKRILEEITKCDVLCANCHMIEHSPDRD